MLVTPDRAGHDLDPIVDAFLAALPPERHDELRALIHSDPEHPSPAEPRDRHPALLPADAATPPAADLPLSHPHPSPPAPVPAIPPTHAAHLADAMILAALRAAATPDNLPLSLPTGPTHLPSPVPTGEGRWVRVFEGVRAVRPRSAVRLSEVTPHPVRWLWPGRIPAGAITLLDGDPGLGKSTLLCEIAARLSRGEALPGGDPGAPRGVLLLSAEDDLHATIRPRIDAAGGDPDRIGALLAIPDAGSTAPGRPVALPGDLPIFEAVIEHLDAALVIVDPLVAYLGPGVSATRDQHVRRALAALTASAQRTGAAFVLVRHLNKSTGANPLYRGIGSIGLIGAARSGLLLAADPDDPERRLLAVAKGNLAPPPPALAFRLEPVPGSHVARVAWEGEHPWTAAEILQGQAGDAGQARRSAVDAARAWLREALAAGPRPGTELLRDATAQGMGKNALYAARRAEGITVAKERIPGGRWLWALAPGAGGDGDEANVPGS